MEITAEDLAASDDNKSITKTESSDEMKVWCGSFLLDTSLLSLNGDKQTC